MEDADDLEAAGLAGRGGDRDAFAPFQRENPRQFAADDDTVRICLQVLDGAVGHVAADGRDLVDVFRDHAIERQGLVLAGEADQRSEERRVEKECRYRWSPY